MKFQSHKLSHQQHNIVDSKLFQQTLRAGTERERAATRNETTTLSSAGAAANAETKANYHHWRHIYSIYRLEIHKSDALDTPYPDAKLDRRTVAMCRGERGVLATVRPEESTMMTSMSLAFGAAREG